MPDLKISQLTADTAPTTDDLVVTVNDPTGTPGNRKVTLGDIMTLLLPAGMIAPYAARTAPSNWLLCDGAAVSRSTYSVLFAATVPNRGTVTMTIAAPAVVTLTSHGFVTGDAIFLTTSIALPTGLTANTLYYVIKVDANTFNLASSQANAHGSTTITTTGSQSGTHTLFHCPYGLGDGSTTFNVPDMRGRVLAGSDTMNGTAASRLNFPTANGMYGELGTGGGEQTHQLSIAELAAHNHNSAVDGYQLNASLATGAGGAGWAGGGTPYKTGSTGSDGAHNNVQPSLVTSYIIKT